MHGDVDSQQIWSQVLGQFRAAYPLFVSRDMKGNHLVCLILLQGREKRRRILVKLVHLDTPHNNELLVAAQQITTI